MMYYKYKISYKMNIGDFMEGRKFGYVRVSSKEQNIDRQINELIALGINERDIFIDKVSGKDFNREQYKILKRVLRKNDVLYIKDIKRFGRNSNEIKNEWREITQDIGADICVIDMPILDTRQYKDTLGNFVAELVLQILAFVAEQERKDIKKSQAEGIAAAKAKGKKFGRPSITFETLSDVQKELLLTNYDRWKQGIIRSVDFMKLLNLKKTTFYKIIKEYKKLRDNDQI
jgi:DNA invertase Pin-like site-specific DNA recombinase